MLKTLKGDAPYIFKKPLTNHTPSPYNPERTHLRLQESKLHQELQEEVEESRWNGMAALFGEVLRGQARFCEFPGTSDEPSGIGG